jgi:hypothetical protein
VLLNVYKKLKVPAGSMNRQPTGVIRGDINRNLPTDTDNPVAEPFTKTIHGPKHFLPAQLPLLLFGKKRQLRRLSLQPVTDQAAAADSRPPRQGPLQCSQSQLMQKEIAGGPGPAGGLTYYMPAVRISQPDPHPTRHLLLRT